ncbi:MAG TPA: carboxypeptidase regulatory-like domain-containing protein [Verrucomicrobiae bacterium]|jgi:hypothetical protein|nr:carboxypeptidase regulatory-like domain-containing protein [Verrucomicrobiae bacterium]
MKDPARTVLGYLAAFTLGVVCMSVIFMATRGKVGRQTPEESREGFAENPASPPPPRPQTFQRLRPPGWPREQEPLSAQPAEVPPAEMPLEQREPEIVAAQEPVIPHVEPVVLPVAAVPTAVVATVSGTGRISGRVRLRGAPPPERILPMDPWCAAQYKSPPKTRFYLTGKDHGLADVLVVLTDGVPTKDRPKPKGPMILAETNCQFEPYISAIQLGQRVVVQNRDKTLHRLHVTSESNGEFNFPPPPGDRPPEIDLKQPEPFVRFKCDAHPWEVAYVSVIEHPFFAVTDRNGEFVMPNVPPGRYKIEVHHRKAGDETLPIEVQANRGTTVEFVLDVGNNRTASR